MASGFLLPEPSPQRYPVSPSSSVSLHLYFTFLFSLQHFHLHIFPLQDTLFPPTPFSLSPFAARSFNSYHTHVVAAKKDMLHHQRDKMGRVMHMMAWVMV